MEKLYILIRKSITNNKKIKKESKKNKKQAKAA